MDASPSPRFLCFCATQLTIIALVLVVIATLIAWNGSAEPATPETLILASDLEAEPVSFRFASDQTAVRYEIRLDDAAWQPSDVTLALPGLSPGPHRLEVRAVNETGLSDPTPMFMSWTTR